MGLVSYFLQRPFTLFWNGINPDKTDQVQKTNKPVLDICCFLKDVFTLDTIKHNHGDKAYVGLKNISLNMITKEKVYFFNEYACILRCSHQHSELYMQIWKQYCSLVQEI